MLWVMAPPTADLPEVQPEKGPVIWNISQIEFFNLCWSVSKMVLVGCEGVVFTVL